MGLYTTKLHSSSYIRIYHTFLYFCYYKVEGMAYNMNDEVNTKLYDDYAADNAADDDDGQCIVALLMIMMTIWCTPT